MQFIVFIGGIHGVGKTTICKRLSENLKINHFICSELINKRLSSKELTKIVEDVNKNQNILIEAVNEFCVEEAVFILDGHFCLKDKDNNIINVPIMTFKELKISEFIVLRSEPKVIAKNLLLRDFITADVDYIEKFQQQEISYANEVADTLKIRLSVFDVMNEWSVVESHISNTLKANVLRS